MITGERFVTGLDITTTHTCAVVLGESAKYDGEVPASRVLGVGLSATEGMSNDTVTNLEATREAVHSCLREAELMAGREVSSVFVGLSGRHVDLTYSTGIVAIAGAEVVPTDVRRVQEVGRAVPISPDRELLHAIPQGYSVDHRGGIQDPLGMSGTRLETEICIVTAASPACRDLRKAVDRAGYRIQEIVLRPIATAHAVLEERERKGGVALVEIGGASTEVAVLEGDRIRRLFTVPLGAKSVSSDIVKGLGVPPDEAERVKERHGVALTKLAQPEEKIEVSGPMPGAKRRVSAELLAHIIEQRMDEIFGLVYDDLEDQGLLDILGSGVVLTGAGVSLPGTLELAQGVFNLPVRMGEPGIGMSGLADAVRRPKFATSVGLAAYGGRHGRRNGRGPLRRVATKANAWLKDFF
ncbi:MAG: cell division protein FtsA [Gemmatimonadota bacterium]|nr:MAG: cell division protein FtsA [Gemmatimonadota bacterium]